jgi:hypothetical protein
MKFTLPRESYLPREANGSHNIETVTAHDAIVYIYSTTCGRFGAVAFHGKAAKPDWHYTFANVDSRQRKIAEYFTTRKEYADYKAKNAAQRKAPHTLNVGDILYTSWGYDQTNIDFYQVTRVVSAHSVEVREIQASSTDEAGFMTAYKSAIPNAFKGESMVKRASSDNCVKIASYAYASPWDGKPKRYSWYA